MKVHVSAAWNFKPVEFTESDRSPKKIRSTHPPLIEDLVRLGFSSFQCGEMAEDKEATTSSLSQGLAPQDPEDPPKSPPNSPNSSTRKACYAVLQSWVSKKFMTGFVVLFPVAVTFLITWWFIQFVDGFFSPIYETLGVDIFGKAENLISPA
ncbi:hypothetical protein N665_1120s0010, partial [Sinapis alba]